VKGLIPVVHPLLVDAPALRCFVPVGSAQEKISDVGMKKIRDSVQWLFAAAETKLVWESKYKKMVTWKINFCTLTIKAGMAELLEKGWTDVKLKSLLNVWLTMARKRFGLKSYVWKAETQKRGVLHFHITSDCYMYWQDIRKSWNRVLTNAGLPQEESNSTDIHAVVDVQKAQEYLIKYFYKEEPNKRTVQGRLWARSHSLSKLKCCVQVPQDEMNELLREVVNTGMMAEAKTYDYAQILSLKDGFYEKLKSSWGIDDEYRSCTNNIRSHGRKK
jgi:hypothetical protein